MTHLRNFPLPRRSLIGGATAERSYDVNAGDYTDDYSAMKYGSRGLTWTQASKQAQTRQTHKTNKQAHTRTHHGYRSGIWTLFGINSNFAESLLLALESHANPLAATQQGTWDESSRVESQRLLHILVDQEKKEFGVGWTGR